MSETETVSVTLSEIECEPRSEEGQIFLQTTPIDNGNEGFNLVVLHGSCVWEGKVTENDLDRHCEVLNMDFNMYVKETTSALTQTAQSDMTFECIFKPLTASNGRLRWKKVPAKNIKYNLGDVDMKKCSKPAEKMSCVLSQCIRSTQSLQSQILSLQTDNGRLAQDRQNALKRLDKCVTAKDELEKDLYSKFVAVLNSKKERIRQLEENHVSQSIDDRAALDLRPSPVASTSRTQVTSSNNRATSADASNNGRSPQDDEPSDNFDVDTDEETPPMKKKKPSPRTTARREKTADSSLNLGDDEEDGGGKVPVARRARRQPTTKKGTPAKPILPRVPSVSSAERSNQLEPRRSSLRKSGSSKSNKSSDNLDPDDLMDDF